MKITGPLWPAGVRETDLETSWEEVASPVQGASEQVSQSPSNWESLGSVGRMKNQARLGLD